MCTVAILCAMDKEIERIVEIFGAVKNSDAGKVYEARVSDTRIVAAVCGIGKVNAAMTAERLILRYSPDAVINCGIAGGLDRSLKVLDMVVAKDAVYHDFHPLSLLDEDPALNTSVFRSDEGLVEKAVSVCEQLKAQGRLGEYTVGRVVSGDSFVESDEDSRRLREDFGAACVEMEGAAIAQVCLLNRVPFLILRAISDFADDSAENSYETFSSVAARQAVEVISGLIPLINSQFGQKL